MKSEVNPPGSRGGTAARFHTVPTTATESSHHPAASCPLQILPAESSGLSIARSLASTVTRKTVAAEAHHASTGSNAGASARRRLQKRERGSRERACGITATRFLEGACGITGTRFLDHGNALPGRRFLDHGNARPGSRATRLQDRGNTLPGSQHGYAAIEPQSHDPSSPQPRRTEESARSSSHTSNPCEYSPLVAAAPRAIACAGG